MAAGTISTPHGDERVDDVHHCCPQWVATIFEVTIKQTSPNGDRFAAQVDGIEHDVIVPDPGQQGQTNG